MPGFNPFRNRFPYTNINDINLDWIIKKVKALSDAVASIDISRMDEIAQQAATAQQDAETALAAAQNAETTADSVQGIANNALTTAQSAQTTATQAASDAQSAQTTATQAASDAQTANNNALSAISIGDYATTVARQAQTAATALDATKADKVQNATDGNFAGLDATGNLTDSGHYSGDFAAAAAGVPRGGAFGQVLTKIGSADYAAAWQAPRGGDVSADMIGIIINGNSAQVGANAGQYVIVKNSTISGITDGLYKAAQAIPANTAINSTYLMAVSNGGLNDLLSRTQWVRLWTNPNPNVAFNAQDVSVSGMADFDEYRIQLSDYMTANAPSLQLVITGYGRGEQWCFNGAKFHYRSFTTTASGVTFRDSSTFQNYGSTQGDIINGYMVPWYIEGKKN